MTANAPVPFGEACAALVPVDLRIDRADGVTLAEGDIDLPCALIGRDPSCEIHLDDPAIGDRHAALQVIAGRVLLADLGSKAGVSGPAGPAPFVWLTPQLPARVGPFTLNTYRTLCRQPIPLPVGFNPFQPCPEVTGRYPRVALKFLTGRTGRAEWQVNRVMTLIGRAADCKINLSADDVADYHCYLLHTAAGLWAVDLHGGGVVVNGNAERYAYLGDGDELTIGRFKLGCYYRTAAQTPPPAKPVNATPSLPMAAPATGDTTTPRPARPAPPSRIHHLDDRHGEVSKEMRAATVAQIQETLAGLLVATGVLPLSESADAQADLRKLAEVTTDLAALAAKPPANPKHGAVEQRRLTALRQELWQKLAIKSVAVG